MHVVSKGLAFSLLAALFLAVFACSKSNENLLQSNAADEETIATYLTSRDADGGPMDSMPPGGGKGCKHLDPSQLPAVILDYIAANYPDAEILHAMLAKNGNYLVEISSELLLVFDPNGAFLKALNLPLGGGHPGDSTGHHPHDSLGGPGHPHDTLGGGGHPPHDSLGHPGGHHHGKGPKGPKGKAVDVNSLPAAISAYITANYPAAVVKAAFQMPSGNYLVLLDDNGKKAGLVFDKDGNFLYKKP